MPGLVPGIYVLTSSKQEDVDGRDEPGHDGHTAKRVPPGRPGRALMSGSRDIGPDMRPSS
jgi:hypothetical protein